MVIINSSQSNRSIHPSSFQAGKVFQDKRYKTSLLEQLRNRELLTSPPDIKNILLSRFKKNIRNNRCLTSELSFPTENSIKSFAQKDGFIAIASTQSNGNRGYISFYDVNSEEPTKLWSKKIENFSVGSEIKEVFITSNKDIAISLDIDRKNATLSIFSKNGDLKKILIRCQASPVLLANDKIYSFSKKALEVRGQDGELISEYKLSKKCTPHDKFLSDSKNLFHVSLLRNKKYKPYLFIVDLLNKKTKELDLEETINFKLQPESLKLIDGKYLIITTYGKFIFVDLETNEINTLSSNLSGKIESINSIDNKIKLSIYNGYKKSLDILEISDFKKVELLSRHSCQYPQDTLAPQVPPSHELCNKNEPILTMDAKEVVNLYNTFDSKTGIFIQPNFKTANLPYPALSLTIKNYSI